MSWSRTLSKSLLELPLKEIKQQSEGLGVLYAGRKYPTFKHLRVIAKYLERVFKK